MSFSQITTAVRDSVARCQTWLSRTPAPCSKNEVQQPEHIAWQALHPDKYAADGFRRHPRSRRSWRKRWLTAATRAARLPALLLTIALLARWRRAASQP